MQQSLHVHGVGGKYRKSSLMCTRLAFTTILVQHASFVQTITCIYNFCTIEVCDSLYSAICAMKYTDSGITSIKAYFVLEATDGYTTETILSGVITISVHSFHPMPIYSSLSSLLYPPSYIKCTHAWEHTQTCTHTCLQVLFIYIIWQTICPAQCLLDLPS